MKTTALLLALIINVSVFAQGTPSYTKLEGNKVKVTWFHENGQIREIGYFNEDKKDGSWISYDSEGNKIAEVSYKDGVKDGNLSVWNENGVLTHYVVYENGKKLIATQWDDDGNLIAGVQSKK